LEELAEIDQIGPTMAKSIFEYFRDSENRSVIEKLFDAGVKPEQPKTRRSEKLAGKTIVVTGTLENLSRQQIQQLDKAEKLGVEVIDEKQFLKMIEE